MKLNILIDELYERRDIMEMLLNFYAHHMDKIQCYCQLSEKEKSIVSEANFRRTLIGDNVT